MLYGFTTNIRIDNHFKLFYLYFHYISKFICSTEERLFKVTCILYLWYLSICVTVLVAFKLHLFVIFPLRKFYGTFRNIWYFHWITFIWDSSHIWMWYRTMKQHFNNFRDECFAWLFSISWPAKIGARVSAHVHNSPLTQGTSRLAMTACLQRFASRQELCLTPRMVTFYFILFHSQWNTSNIWCIKNHRRLLRN